jgi:peptidyl-dipeptidase Dcp
MLANTTYPSLSGTNVYWDFVELPSQVLENWCYEKECLDLFAHHYKTGEPIPEAYVKRLKDSATFNEGYATLRQLSFGMLDMAWHHNLPERINDVGDFEDQAISRTQLFEPIKTSNSSCAFSHIFQGGYSAGYYSYKWAEVLDADAFELFKENGLFDQETAAKFRALLAAGGTEHPMELYKRFRGHEPDVKALLRRAGLIEG